jgi:general secretion pathway protein M
MKIADSIHLRRRALFVSGNMAIVAVVVVAFLLPARAFFADRDTLIADKLKMLARLNAIAAHAANVESIASETSAQLRSGEFLTGPNENVISADLQTRLKALTDGAGARSRAVQALPLKIVEQNRFSGSRIEIFGSLQSIHRAIYAIESAKPYLFISGAVIKTAPAINRRGVPEEPVIQAQLDVFGAVQVNGKEP